MLELKKDDDSVEPKVGNLVWKRADLTVLSMAAMKGGLTVAWKVVMKVAKMVGKLVEMMVF
jgi:hypothetical protein